MGRRREKSGWTQRWWSSETESPLLLLPLLIRCWWWCSSFRSWSSSALWLGEPRGWDWWICAWWIANPNNVPAAYLCVGDNSEDAIVDTSMRFKFIFSGEGEIVQKLNSVWVNFIVWKLNWSINDFNAYWIWVFQICSCVNSKMSLDHFWISFRMERKKRCYSTDYGVYKYLQDR